MKIDLCFTLMGRIVPVDHGYALYSALSRVLPVIHEDRDVGIRLIRGRYVGGGVLDLSPASELVLRLPTDKLSQYINLAGKSFEMFGQTLRIGVPRMRMLFSGEKLSAQLVTTRNGNNQARFEAEIDRQIKSLEVSCALRVTKRRTFEVHGKQVVGYSVALESISPEASIVIQEKGLGGRRKMGCGFFEVVEE